MYMIITENYAYYKILHVYHRKLYVYYIKVYVNNRFFSVYTKNKIITEMLQP